MVKVRLAYAGNGSSIGTLDGIDAMDTESGSR